MSEITQLKSDEPVGLTVYDRRVYWLENDPASRPVRDELGRAVPRQKLIEYDVDVGEKKSLADGLPPSHTLAVDASGAYVWDPQRGDVRQVRPDGEVRDLTTIEGHPDGELTAFDGRLFYVGSIHPGAVGVAMYSLEEDDWEILLDTEDPSITARALIHVGAARVYYVHHGVDSWRLDTIDLEGELESRDIALDDVVPRELSGRPGELFVGTEEDVRFFDETGEQLGRVPTAVPVERLTTMARRAVWVEGAVIDAESGEESWSVRAAERGDSEGAVLVESKRAITSLDAGDWGCTCLTTSPDDAKRTILVVRA